MIALSYYNIKIRVCVSNDFYDLSVHFISELFSLYAWPSHATTDGLRLFAESHTTSLQLQSGSEGMVVDCWHVSG